MCKDIWHVPERDGQLVGGAKTFGTLRTETISAASLLDEWSDDSKKLLAVPPEQGRVKLSRVESGWVRSGWVG